MNESKSIVLTGNYVVSKILKESKARKQFLEFRMKEI